VGASSADSGVPNTAAPPGRRVATASCAVSIPADAEVAANATVGAESASTARQIGQWLTPAAAEVPHCGQVMGFGRTPAIIALHAAAQSGIRRRRPEIWARRAPPERQGYS
jgi:hypothetical protein